MRWNAILDQLAGGHDAVRVLLVEDDPADQALVADRLRAAEAGVVLSTVAALEDAVEPLSRGLADLVLLDLPLPEAGGVRRLRAAAPGVPVVVLSESDDADGSALHRALAFAVERRRSERRLARLALSDPLTGLPNRVLFADRLEQALTRAVRAPTRGRKAPRLILMLVDLDAFQSVNDALGHPAGDAVLIEVARRLEHQLRGADTVARLGGDEFALLCENVPGADGGVVLARRIAGALGEPYVTEAGAATVSAAIGIAVADPRAEDAAALLQRADAALHAARREGRGRVAVASGP